MNQIEEEISKQELSADKEELLSKLQKLVSKNELLKEKEAEFKDQCRTEMEQIIRENEKLEQELKTLKGRLDDREWNDFSIENNKIKLIFHLEMFSFSTKFNFEVLIYFTHWYNAQRWDLPFFCLVDSLHAVAIVNPADRKLESHNSEQCTEVRLTRF